MVNWKEFLVSTAGLLFLYLGLLVLDSGLPVVLSQYSHYSTTAGLLLVLSGASVAIYGLGIDSKKSRKKRFVEILDDLLGTMS